MFKTNLVLHFLGFVFLSTISYSQTAVKLSKEGGVYTVPCKVNGVPLKFIFDTGASDVLISKETAQTLMQQGKLFPTDFLLSVKKYKTASGDIVENQEVIIRELQISNLVLPNVRASVAFPFFRQWLNIIIYF